MELRKLSVSLLVVVGFVLGPVGAGASVSTSGTLKAERECEAFVSKRNKSNPDKARLEPGDAYALLELNRPEQPTWYRVRVAEASPPLRWVEASCGTATLPGTPEGDGTDTPPPQPDDPALCSTAGLQDSYVLALSWQPAFCESHRNKKECALQFDATYQQAGNFTLHGLWPNREACGTSYGNCARQPRRSDFCAYPSIELEPGVAHLLREVMPGTASCLERHEWWKHGTCQVEWDTSQYYEVAISLVRQFNDAGMKQYMASNMGRRVTTADFLRQVDSALGAGTSQRLQLSCVGGKLTDVYIGLSAHTAPGASLSELVLTAPRDFRSKCPATFTIDAVGF